MSSHIPHHHRPQHAEVQELPAASNSEVHDDGSIGMSILTGTQGGMEEIQDSFIQAAVGDDPKLADDDDESLGSIKSKVDFDLRSTQQQVSVQPGESRVENNPQSTQQQFAKTNITFAMLKRVANELVEVTMKLSDESKKVSVCGMMLRATNLLKGNGVLGQAGLEESVEHYLQSFVAHNQNLFPGGTTVPDGLPQAPPCFPSVGRPSAKRLRSATKIFRCPRNGAPKRRLCGFCLEDGHTVNQCTMMAQIGKQVLHSDKDQFCYNILETFAVNQLNHRQHPNPTILPHVVGAAHIAIVGLYAASRNATTIIVNKKKSRDIGVQQVIAKVIILGEGGNPITVHPQEQHEHDFHTLTSVLSWIAKSSSRKLVFHSLKQLNEVDAFEYQYTTY